MPDNKKNPKPRMLSVEETNAMLEKEFAEQNSKAEESPPKEGESKVIKYYWLYRKDVQSKRRHQCCDLINQKVERKVDRIEKW